MPDDLFGAPIPDPPATKRKRKPTPPKGGAHRAGSGPAGETCGTCANAARFGRYAKCKLVRGRWTNGPGTDIRLRWPACSGWQATST